MLVSIAAVDGLLLKHQVISVYKANLLYLMSMMANCYIW